VNANASGEAAGELSEDGLPVTSMDAIAARSAALYGLLAEKETR
jgi:hypothetical protein